MSSKKPVLRLPRARGERGLQSFAHIPGVGAFVAPRQPSRDGRPAQPLPARQKEVRLLVVLGITMEELQRAIEEI
eukprot:scaffold154775_cov26-Tisochrysis_lutea.AAC.1